MRAGKLRTSFALIERALQMPRNWRIESIKQVRGNNSILEMTISGRGFPECEDLKFARQVRIRVEKRQPIFRVKEFNAQDLEYENETEENFIKDFVSDCCIDDPIHRIEFSLIWDRFVRWCDYYAEKNPGRLMFKKYLKERYQEIKESDATYYRGIRLKEED